MTSVSQAQTLKYECSRQKVTSLIILMNDIETELYSMTANNEHSSNSPSK